MRSIPFFGLGNSMIDWSISKEDIGNRAQSVFPKPPFRPRRIIALSGGIEEVIILRAWSVVKSFFPCRIWLSLRFFLLEAEVDRLKELPNLTGLSIKSMS